MEDVTDCRIFQTTVGENVAVLEIFVCLCSTCEHFFNVSTGNRDGKKTYGSENGVSAADVVSDHEAFVAVCVSLGAESTLLCVGGSVDTFSRAFLAVFFDQEVTENTECDRGLGCCTGFGDHVYTNILAFADREDVLQVRGADILTDEVNVGSFLGLIVIVIAVDEFDRCACAEIRAADTDNDQDVAHGLNLFSRLLHLCNLCAVKAYGKIYPAEKIVAFARFIAESLVCRIHFIGNCKKICLSDKAVNILVRKNKCHI